MNVHVSLGEPVVVAQAPESVRHWGPYQFPFLERLPDGRIHACYHVEADSALSYGLPVGHAVSGDEGRSWRHVDCPLPERPDLKCAGLALPNGDRLVSVVHRPLQAADVSLPEPFAMTDSGYGHPVEIYRAEDLPDECRGWCFARLPAGESQWVSEQAAVAIGVMAAAMAS